MDIKRRKILRRFKKYCEKKFLDLNVVHDPKCLTNDEAVTGSKHFFHLFLLLLKGM
jgi:hypothetical protein